jgi:hypothetical protein
MRKVLLVLALVPVGMAGCQKLNVEGETEVPMATPHPISISAPAYKQKMKITIEPESASVSAYLVKKEDAEAADRAMAPGKAPPDKLVLAGKTFKPKGPPEPFTLEATVSAGTECVLIIHGGSKTTKVKYRIVGR